MLTAEDDRVLMTRRPAPPPPPPKRSLASSIRAVRERVEEGEPAGPLELRVVMGYIRGAGEEEARVGSSSPTRAGSTPEPGRPSGHSGAMSFHVKTLGSMEGLRGGTCSQIDHSYKRLN